MATGRSAPPEGLLVVDKPGDWTSHDVVARCRRLLRTRKVGHAGTLDPMATGVLVLGVGRATRLLTFLVGSDKSYSATIRLGQTTVTDDAEGEPTCSTPTTGLTRDRILAAMADLTGAIDQVPSAVSAVKVDGRRSYHRVRSGEDVDLPPRPVTVARFELIRVHGAQVDGIPVLDLDVEVECSSGTYVRALARDLGSALGVGGHLTALRRTRVGGFTLGDATTLAELEARVAEQEGVDQSGPDSTDRATAVIIPLGQAARSALPVREVTEDEARALGYGQRIPSAVPGRSDPVAAIAPGERLVAVLDESSASARARVVFAPAGS